MHAVYTRAYCTKFLHIDDLMFSFAHSKFGVIPTYFVYEIFATRLAVGFRESKIVSLKLTLTARSLLW